MRDEKAGLRREMRAMRRALPDRPARADRIAARVLELPQIERARHVLLFDSLPVEPEMTSLRAALAERHIDVAVPEDDVDPSWPDVVVVPGLAFTSEGDRLGQGGGWYDRFLPRLREGCTTVGVAFAEQIVDSLPVEPHDVRVQFVVTDG